jgi:hypothetical protein
MEIDFDKWWEDAGVEGRIKAIGLAAFDSQRIDRFKLLLTEAWATSRQSERNNAP